MFTDIQKLLKIAGVPSDLIANATSSLDKARKDKKGLWAAKWKTRLFKNEEIAKKLSWESNRLIEVDPSAGDDDIAMVTNVTCNGDNGPWRNNAQGQGRPRDDHWLNKDPNSIEYKDAVASCYWCKGAHPRSEKARAAWYRRNAGEGRAYRLGCEVNEAEGVKIWRGAKGRTHVIVYKSGNAWQIRSYFKLVGKLKILSRIGYEVDNVFSGDYAPQMWYAIDGYKLKAPLSWTVLPTTGEPPPRKRFEGIEQN